MCKLSGVTHASVMDVNSWRRAPATDRNLGDTAFRVPTPRELAAPSDENVERASRGKVLRVECRDEGRQLHPAKTWERVSGGNVEVSQGNSRGNRATDLGSRAALEVTALQSSQGTVDARGPSQSSCTQLATDHVLSIAMIKQSLEDQLAKGNKALDKATKDQASD